MKLRIVKAVVVLAASGTVLGLFLHSLSPSELGSQTPFAELAATPVTEMPSVAAALVRMARPEARETVVREVLRDMVALDKPCAMPYVIAAICRENPGVAPVAVVTAAKLQPTDTFASVRAAVSAAPEQTGQIISSFAAEFPELAHIAGAVAAAALPDQRAQIILAIGRALPDLRPFVEQVVRQHGNQLDVMAALSQAQGLAATAAREAEQQDRRQAVQAELSRSQAGRPAYSAKELVNIQSVAAAEMARVEAAVAAKPVAGAPLGVRSAAFRGAPPLVMPAGLKVPSASQIKAGSADFGIRDTRIYSRP